ncbi:hypothetical protein VTP01DRAFT_4392 [Rhizomucor pusillus]|uniref:uncharacterized protein n=1 Tax=Rhizomucor pusillus TaxID=4840 RepID=UPI0037424437
MKIQTTALLATLLLNTATAFEGTVPCLMWSSKDYLEPVHKFSKQLVLGEDQALAVIQDADVCGANVIAVIDQPGVHLNDFSSPEYDEAFTALKSYHRNAVSTTQLDYVADGVNIDQIVSTLSNKCSISSVSRIQDPTMMAIQEHHTIAVLELGTAKDASELQKNDEKVDQFMKNIQENADGDYVVIYTSSSPKKTLTKRHILERRAPVNDNAPIFEKYQLFTPGVFMAIAVGFIFVTITSIGVTWLSGIQTPVRFEGKSKK